MPGDNLGSCSKFMWITLLSTLLIVGWAVSPAVADHCKGQHKNDPGCDGGGDPPNNDLPPSLDRSAVVYVNGPGDSINVADADGNNQTTLFTRRRTSFWYPSWSPDGDTIIFASNLDPQGPGIYRLRLDRVNGTVQGPDKIIPVNDGLTLHPVWSPVPTLNADGTSTYKIAYADFDVLEDRNVLFLADVSEDGEILGAPFRLKTYPLAGHEGFDEMHPSWSPDASKLAIRTWEITRGSGTEIITLGLDCVDNEPVCEVPGTRRDLIAELGPLSPFDRWDGLPSSWANTGNMIAVDGVAAGSGVSDVWIIKFDDTGTDITNLTDINNSTLTDRDANTPTWSPDSTQIMYQAWNYLCEPQTTRRGQGWNLIIRNVNGAPIDGCAEKMIVQDGRMPNWWRNADTLPLPPQAP